MVSAICFITMLTTVTLGLPAISASLVQPTGIAQATGAIVPACQLEEPGVGKLTAGLSSWIAEKLAGIASWKVSR